MRVSGLLVQFPCSSKLLLIYIKLFVVLEEKENSQPTFFKLVEKRLGVLRGPP